MVDRELLKQNIVENINDNGRQKITGSKLQKQLLEMVDSMLDPEGRYPDMSVGFSDNLVGRGESTPAEFTFRATGGKSIKDGAARIKRIKGNSVVWNQKIDKQYISQDSVITLRQGESLTTGHKYLLMRSQGGGGCYLMPAPDVYTYSLGDNRLSMIFTSEYSCTSEGVYPSYPHIYCIGESGYVQLIDLTQMFQAGNEPSTIEEYNARKPIVADEYAYNGGQVIHCNTESIKSVGDNAWDEEWEIGGIYTNNGESFDIDHNIRSKDYNRIIGGQEYSFLSAQTGALILYDEHYNYVDYWNIAEGQLRVLTIADNAAYFKICLYDYTYKNGTMLRLNHSGWKSETGVGYEPYWQDTLPLPIIRKYFPDGMKKAGAAHDEIRFNKASGKWEKVMRIGSVDMGSLTWEKEWYNEAEAYRIFANITNKAAGLSNILCGAYTNANVGDGIMADFTITGNTSTNYVYLKDSSYSAEGVDALIDSLQGVMLYYELAEPVIREIDEPIGTDYRVADFGTEQAQSSVPSAPFSADIIYQFNAVDMIREHQIEIENLKSMVATMQTYLTSLVFQEK